MSSSGSDRTSTERAKVVLKAKSNLAALPDAVIDQLLRHGRLVRFKKGEAVYRQGDAGDSLLVVLTGRVKAWTIAADAREIVLNFIGQGGVTGELAILDGKPRSANVSALEATEGLLLYRRDILPVLEQHPKAMLDLIAVLSGKIRALSAQVEQAQLQLSAKAAAGLLRLADAHGQKVSDGVRIDLKVSQRDLAAYLGMSRENANRQLGELRDAGLIMFEDAHIIVLDREGLGDIAGSA